MTDDEVQLGRYAREGMEDAFGALVARHLPLVYSAALRQVGGDEPLAKDVAQKVFIELARHAGLLCRRGMISGWLYITTRNIATKTVRGERRRRTREQTCAVMQELHSQAAPEPDWSQISPVLDQAMARLSPTDRNAVLLRFFEDKDLKTVGAALGVSEDAARMRVNRALESLRGMLRQRGVVLSSVMLGSVLASQAVGAVPAGLAQSITGAALASTVTSGGAVASFLQTAFMTKLKIGLIGIVVAASAVAPWVIERQARNRLQNEVQALRLKSAGMDALSSENARLSNWVAQTDAAAALSRGEKSELLRLRGEAGRLREENRALVKAGAAGGRRGVGGTGSRGETGAKEANVEELNIDLAKESWAPAGYASPENALQTMLWARREGDFKTLVASVTPEFVEKAQKAWGDKFEDQLKQELPGDLDWVSKCLIRRRETISEDEVKLFYALAANPVPFGDNGSRMKSLGCGVTAKRIGNEWKIQP